MIWVSYRVEVSLVKLVHSSLQLAALALPLLKIADRLHGGTLPRGGTGVVVHIIDPAPVIHSALPSSRVKEMGGAINRKTHKKKQASEKKNERELTSSWRRIVSVRSFCYCYLKLTYRQLNHNQYFVWWWCVSRQLSLKLISLQLKLQYVVTVCNKKKVDLARKFEQVQLRAPCSFISAALLAWADL